MREFFPGEDGQSKDFGRPECEGRRFAYDLDLIKPEQAEGRKIIEESKEKIMAIRHPYFLEIKSLSIRVLL